jgi:hypothetical protein
MRPYLRATLAGGTALATAFLFNACGGSDGSGTPDTPDASVDASGGSSGAMASGGSAGVTPTGGTGGTSGGTGGLGGSGGAVGGADSGSGGAGGVGLDAGNCDNRTLFYIDEDGDGFGDPNQTFEACALQTGLSVNGDDCDDTTDITYPGAMDSAVIAGDQNCDGLEGDASHSIYVIPPPPVVDGGLDGGMDASQGAGGAANLPTVDAGDGGDASPPAPGSTPALAFTLIQDGIDAAAACAGSPCEVLVAGGTTVEALALADGVTVTGGLDPTFTGAGDPTVVMPPPGLAANTATVTGDALANPTTLAGLTIHGPDRSAAVSATTGESSVAVSITGSGQANVSLIDTEIVVGLGGKGADGVTGAAGPVTCATAYAGGTGGPGGLIPDYMCDPGGGVGQAGEGPNNVGSTAGDGGAEGIGNCNCPDACTCANKCGWSPSSVNGAPGHAGGAGDPGSAGTSAASTAGQYQRNGSLLAFVGDQSATGGTGQTGSGGGGGGAGADLKVCGESCCSRNAPQISGPAGGDGGDGGCGGLGGTGGWQGGAAIGIEVVDTSLSLQNVSIYGGAGGDGGVGGQGGPGATGAAGMTGTGAAATGCGTTPTDLSTGSASGAGGDGGDGGDGGQGGGGNGGVWLGVALVNELNVASVLGTPVVTAATAGSGGDGGQTGKPGTVADVLSYDVL